ncbi:MAG: penicillin-binding transpeptidase domain-containing protein [Actinomycetota bacterium]|nr:penicillin-binding transpeptidase domain-containing protein [Actinomycetota bacterium]
MNKQIRKLVAGLLVLYIGLFAMLNVAQLVRKDALNANPLNNRQTIRDFNRMRGPIVTADGVVVARSVPTIGDDQFKYQREYPTGDLFSNVSGYYTYSFGSTQLEKTQGQVLMGDTTRQKFDSVLGGADNTGSVLLTLRDDLQRVAADALGEREGSVVVMDPASGAILAMVSFPRFDPNAVADHDTQYAEDVLTYLNAFPGKPLLANAYQENYMPGSSFKVITTGIAFENGVTNLDRSWPSESEWVPPQTTDPIQNYGGRACGGSMVEVFYRSCNIPFAQLASELGPQRMTDGVRAWGIGEPLPIDLPGAVASSFCGNVTPCDASYFNDQLPLLAIGGFGQGNDVMVPLHMCMVAATVANGGRMMQPYVTDATLKHDGTVLDRTDPTVWKTPISPGTAATLNTLMVGVVNRGTGTAMQLAGGIQAAAKTGTAQLNFVPGQPQRSHAWIIGFAPAEAPRYAVAVILKGTTDEVSASTGGKLAGPIAKTVLDFLFASEK